MTSLSTRKKSLRQKIQSSKRNREERSELWSLVWLQKQQIVIKENEGNLISIRQETNRCAFLLVQFSQTSHKFISLFIRNDIIFYTLTWRKLKQTIRSQSFVRCSVHLRSIWRSLDNLQGFGIKEILKCLIRNRRTEFYLISQSSWNFKKLSAISELS